ncbi:GspE/PulE family protein [Paraburkholderia heleia]|uniref:GspE/PulE family protein n=1 Tax=Paraburkholderia heleia TaxID=634127 RepID=UPI002AB63C8C|nr:GspE/PulE family protein [Paraburkholderia heleia]
MDVSESLASEMTRLGLIDSVRLEYVRQRNRVVREPLWKTVVESGLASERDVTRALANVLKADYLEPDEIPPSDPQVLGLFSKEFCLRNSFLPLAHDAGILQVLAGSGDHERIAEAVATRGAMRCRFALSEFSTVRRLIHHRYHFVQQPAELLVRREVESLVADASGVRSPEQLLQYLLHQAVRDRATDVHIAPAEGAYHILFRIDGVLSPITAIPRTLERLVSYVKLLAEMDISEQRRPQDGSFRCVILDTDYTIRVSTIATEAGERMVMRLLPEAHDLKGLRELGFFPEDVERIQTCLANPSGLMLVTGPTGSGKSSTLHAGLRVQRLIERNILTVEDPLEYRVAGAAQTEVNRRAGYDFASALKHFLRHDPDVILVGEMRDAETAQAALDAAATGHLVLSTLHITSVFGLMPRLVPLGVSPQIVAENLLLVVNQRLVRRNCPHCAAQREWTAQERVLLGLQDVKPSDVQAVISHGCERCRHTGYVGRLPVYEILGVTDDLANAIAVSASRARLNEIALADGFLPIRACARRRVLAGETTCAEMVRVLGEDV